MVRQPAGTDRVLAALVRTRDEAINGDRHVTGGSAHDNEDSHTS